MQKACLHWNEVKSEIICQGLRVYLVPQSRKCRKERKEETKERKKDRRKEITYLATMKKIM